MSSTLALAALSLFPVHAPALPAPAQSSPPAVATTRVIDPAKVDACVQRHMATPGAVGLSVAIGLGDEVVVSRGYGLADLEFEVPANEETMFRIGSVTKQFTAALLVRLQEQGKLHVDDLLSQYVPEYATEGREITLRHVLTHTAGIPNYTDYGREWIEHVSHELTDEEMLALIARRPLVFAPGERMQYSNSGYYLLGIVAARASEKEYAAALQAELFEPLGLARTRYDSNGEVIRNRAQGYGFEEDRLWNDRLIGMSQPGAAGALLSTAADLVRWEIALAGGKVVSPESYEEMTTPFLLESGEESPYGFGLSLGEVAGRPCVSHGGGIFGFNSWLGRFPEDGLTVAVISNSEGLSATGVALDLVRECVAD
jgi:CubicO group peptidase (beta-lactamase class C family)